MPPSKTGLTPLSELKVTTYQIAAHGLTPNTSVQKKPLMIYHSAFTSPSLTASVLESHLKSIGVVVPQWRYTMFSYSHFHSTTHEVLCISRGRARLCFGHEDNTERVMIEAQRGDVIVIPAGVSHRLMEDLGQNFEMVGSYPKGCEWDMCYGREDEEQKLKEIGTVRWFEKDPIYGNEGPVLDV